MKSVASQLSTLSANDSTTDLAISIGTMDNIVLLTQCLTSIFAQNSSPYSFHIFIIYNGYKGESGAAELRQKFPQTTVLCTEPRIGYVGVHNLILRNVRARYIMILDDDTIVHEGALRAVCRHMDANPDIGLSGCKTMNPDGSLHRSYGVSYTLYTELLNALKLRDFYPDFLYEPLVTRDVEWISGAIMVVRREALEHVGPLDDYYFTLVCEPDWCYRMRKNGWRVTFIAEAEIVHLGGEHSFNVGDKSYENLLRYHTNRFYYFRKHMGEMQMHLLRPIMIVGAILRVIYYSFIAVCDASRRPQAKLRVAAFARLVRLSFSREPFRLPVETRHRPDSVIS